MDRIAASVERVGFRKWYERELLTCHGYLVLTFLSVVALIGTVEAYREGSDGQKALNATLFLVCAVIGAWSLRRYLYLMLRAEGTANQASCPECGDYGRFGVVRTRPIEREMEVRCRRCACRWVISDLQ